MGKLLETFGLLFTPKSGHTGLDFDNDVRSVIWSTSKQQLLMLKIKRVVVNVSLI